MEKALRGEYCILVDLHMVLLSLLMDINGSPIRVKVLKAHMKNKPCRYMVECCSKCGYKRYKTGDQTNLAFSKKPFPNTLKQISSASCARGQKPCLQVQPPSSRTKNTQSGSVPSPPAISPAFAISPAAAVHRSHGDGTHGRTSWVSEPGAEVGAKEGVTQGLHPPRGLIAVNIITLLHCE